MSKNTGTYNPLSDNRIIVFTKSVETLYNSGINLFEAIRLCDFYDVELNKIKYILLEKMKNGISFSKSLAETEAFPQFYIQWIELAYETGNLSKCFQYLITFYETKVSTKNKVIKSMIYPIIVFILAIGTMFFMTIHIFPIFLELIEDIPYELWPAPTKIMNNISFFLKHTWILFLVLTIILIILIVLSDRSEYLNYKKNALLFKSPMLKKRMTLKFEKDSSYILFLLVESGLSFQQSVLILSQTFSNAFYKEKLRNIYIELEKGTSPVTSFKHSKIVTDFFLHVLENNVLSGQVQQGLLQISNLRTLEFELITAKRLKLLEPLLIIIAAMLIGFILLASILPILEVTNYI